MHVNVGKMIMIDTNKNHGFWVPLPFHVRELITCFEISEFVKYKSVIQYIEEGESNPSEFSVGFLDGFC